MHHFVQQQERSHKQWWWFVSFTFRNGRSDKPVLGAANSNQNNVVFNGNKISKHSASCLTTFYPAPSKNGSSSHAGLYSLSWESSLDLQLWEVCQVIECTEDQESVIVFYLLSFSIYYYYCFLGKRVVQLSTGFHLSYIFSFFSAENTKKRRLEQNTVRWWSMVAYVVFSPFQVTWVCRSLQSNSLNLRCWYVRVLFGGIIPPMCCVTQKLIFSWDFYSDDEKRFERQKSTLRTVPVESL